jgi:hypothetical protein
VFRGCLNHQAIDSEFVSDAGYVELSDLLGIVQTAQSAADHVDDLTATQAGFTDCSHRANT